eukprot:s2487_g7.t1
MERNMEPNTEPFVLQVVFSLLWFSSELTWNPVTNPVTPVTQAPEGEDKAEDLADTYEGELAWMSEVPTALWNEYQSKTGVERLQKVGHCHFQLDMKTWGKLQVSDSESQQKHFCKEELERCKKEYKEKFLPSVASAEPTEVTVKVKSEPGTEQQASGLAQQASQPAQPSEEATGLAQLLSQPAQPSEKATGLAQQASQPAQPLEEAKQKKKASQPTKEKTASQPAKPSEQAAGTKQTSDKSKKAKQEKKVATDTHCSMEKQSKGGANASQKNAKFQAKLAEKIKEAQKAHGGLQPNPPEDDQHTSQAEIKIKKEPAEPSHTTAKTKTNMEHKEQHTQVHGGEGVAISAAGEASASSSSSSLVPCQPVASGSAASSSTAANPAEPDVTNLFGPDARDGAQEPEGAKAKDLFSQADLIVPAIALKKMKQAMQAGAEESLHYVALLGGQSVSAYRLERQGVAKMILANLAKYANTFWARAGEHLRGLSAVLLMVAMEADDVFVKDVT